jgi:hypothetical protein
MGKVVCTKCQCEDVRRVRRQGILERWVLPKLSLYPFLCGRCGGRFLASGSHQKRQLTLQQLTDPPNVQPR